MDHYFDPGFVRMISLFYAANVLGAVTGFGVADSHGLFEGLVAASTVLVFFPAVIQYFWLKKKDDNR